MTETEYIVRLVEIEGLENQRRIIRALVRCDDCMWQHNPEKCYLSAFAKLKNVSIEDFGDFFCADGRYRDVRD